MVLTPDGEEFMDYARDILHRIDKIEQSYRDGSHKKRKFSISVPRACYISAAMAEFSKNIGDTPVEIYYKETNSKKTIKKLLENEYKLGIIRYSDNYDKYYKDMLEEKGLSYELVAEFSYVLIMSRDNPLAEKETITYEDLSDYIEIAHADPYVPTLSMSKVFREELPDKVDQRILYSREQVSLTFSQRTPKPSCGYLPHRNRYLTDIILFSVCARAIKRYIGMFSSIIKDISLLNSIRISLPRFAMQEGSS
jgi:DNA-binding transcriptional LysR family regulator